MFLILLIIGVVARFLPHPANFIPIGAILMFAPKKMGYKKSVLLAILIMTISDIFLGFSQVTPYVYLGMFGYIAASKLINKKPVSYFATSVSGSVLFFLISNFGVWLSPWYEHSFAGLTRCFVLALPFFKNTALGDITYLVALVALEYAGAKIYNINGATRTKSNIGGAKCPS